MSTDLSCVHGAYAPLCSKCYYARVTGRDFEKDFPPSLKRDAVYKAIRTGLSAPPPPDPEDWAHPDLVQPNLVPPDPPNADEVPEGRVLQNFIESQQRTKEMHAAIMRHARTLKPSTSDGSSADYYQLPPGATELQDLISYRDMNAQLGEIFRAAYRYGLSSHSSKLRDAKKIKFYIHAEIRRLEGEDHE